MVRADEHTVRTFIRTLPGAVVALSGGVDSAVVLQLARTELKHNLLAVTATGHIYPPADLAYARRLAAALGVRHRELPMDQLADPLFAANPPDRCYRCKSMLFAALRTLAAAEGFRVILDGTNAEDAQQYRPGLRAAAEAGVVSPLRAAGLTKEQVRNLAKNLGLDFWNRPSESCLATRIPYGEPLTRRRLEQVRRGEEFLRGLGYTTVRVRHHGALARIEVDPALLPRLITAPHRELVLEKLRQLGFRFVTADLAGYRFGCFDGEPR
jgi:uncharacterized protein